MDITGKTIKSAPKVDQLEQWSTSIELEFTDGTSLTINTCGCCGLWYGEEQPER